MNGPYHAHVIQWRAPPCPGLGFLLLTGPGHLIRSRTTCPTPMPVMRVKGHRGWPFGAQAPGPDDCAANDVAPGAGAVFAKPAIVESPLP